MNDSTERCGAKTRSGDTCKRAPSPDATRCRLHGGASPNAQRAASERRTRREALKQLSILGHIPETNVDPTAALLELITQKHCQVTALREIVAELEANAERDDTGEVDLGRHPLVWGISNHEKGVGVHGPIDKTTEAPGVSVWLKLLQEAEDQLARYTTAAMKAGVEQRQMDLLEEHATQLAQVITRVLDQLDLSSEQQKLIPSVVPPTLREFTAAHMSLN